MRKIPRALGAGSQLIVMAAIVGSLLYFPLGLVLVLLCALAGIPAQSLITFAGVLGTVSGMLVWWLVSCTLALAYAAVVFPWHGNVHAGQMPKR
jgi:succinate-acetate transporter protein